jgi:hypothetical protein
LNKGQEEIDLSYPNLPNISPDINLSREDVINLLLASIAFEELGLAHLINAEAEKIQFVLGTLEEQELQSPTLNDLLEINRGVERTLRSVIKNQMLLQFKLEDTLQLTPGVPLEIFSNTVTVEGFFNDILVTATDIAYYNTGKVVNSP